MARPLRIEYPGAVYHVTARGNEKKPIFRDAGDRELFLDLLKRVNDRHQWLCHAYCLMDNHYHLLIETPEGNLSQGMRQLNGVYTQRFNITHDRVGHLFQGRFKAIIIEKEPQLLAVARYVVLNPVRAKITNQPSGWRWSSYNGTAGRQKPHPCLTYEEILGRFGNTVTRARQKYREFISEGIGADSIWNDVRGQLLLGSTEFITRISRLLGTHKTIQEIPRSQRLVDRPRLQDIFSTHNRKHKATRNKKIIAAVEKYGYAQSEIAEYLDMHYSTISRIINEKSQN